MDFDLDELISSKPNHFDDYVNILDLLDQVTECLTQLHSEGYAYRFLRPENILVNNHYKYFLNNPSLQFNSKESVIYLS